MEDVLTSQLDAYELLAALYCMPGEFEPEEEDVLAKLRNEPNAHLPDCLRFAINVSIQKDSQYILSLHIRLPIQAATASPTPVMHLSHPTWLERKPNEQLSSELKEATSALQEEDAATQVIAAVDFLKDHGLEYLPSASSPSDKAININKDTLVRIWMHLPSLSTKSKRDDLVHYASCYGITGIVSAGKPGLLILEAATASDVESYLSYIKTHSWADIPAGHKKVSEKLREEGLKQEDRAFKDMQEITEIVNVDGMKGVRSNRGDLGALRTWLEQRGLGGDRLARVLGTNMSS